VTPPPPPLTVVGAEASGINRVGKSIEIYAGALDPTVNKVRYTPFKDGVGQTPVTQSIANVEDGNLVYTMPSGTEYTLFSCTVEWSADNGSSWSAPVEPYYSFYPDTLYTEPSALPTDLVATRTSGAGVTPVTFSITGRSCQAACGRSSSSIPTSSPRRIAGRKPVTEYEIANLIIDLDGATGPALDPVMSALGATEILKFRLVTQDWDENPINPGDNVGLAGRWVAVSATNFGGNQLYKLSIASTPQGVGGAVVMVAVELAESVGGPNLLRGGEVNVFYSAGDESPSPPGGATFQSDHIFDGSAFTYGALTSTPVDLTFDMLVARPMNRLRITSTVNNYQQAPAAFTFGPCDAAGNYIGSPLSVSGQTWSSSADETKQWSF
jgi:hypothetical protein